MRIEELSIGDWVCAEQLCGVHNEPRLTPPMKVVGLGESWVNLEIDPEQGDPFEFEPSEIRGVPITPEILEKNGFVKESEVGYERFEWRESGVAIILNCLMHSDRRIFTLTTSNLGVNGWLLRTEHIHQLQCAIRLAGFDKEIEL